MGNQPGMNEKMGPGGKGATPGKDSGSAPLLWLYPVAVIAGIIVGFALPSTKQRKLVLAACCGVAILVPVLQAVIGFPIEKSVEKDLKEGLGGLGDPMTAPGGKTGDGKGAQAEMKKQLDEALKDAFRVSYQIWFYFALLVPIGALVTAVIEPIGRPRRKKPLYDMDDGDEDDEEEDRPRKRRRRDDDEDEEDEEPRQRKKGRDEDEEDEPKPRRKKRADDDDEDEPKPRRRRDE